MENMVAVSDMRQTQDEAPIAFYDVAVFPNLFIVEYKLAGEGNPVIRLINPTPDQIEEMLQYRLIGPPSVLEVIVALAKGLEENTEKTEMED